MDCLVTGGKPGLSPEGHAELSAYRSLQTLVRARPLPWNVSDLQARRAPTVSVVRAGAVSWNEQQNVYLIRDRAAILSLLKDSALVPVDLGALIEFRARQHGFDPTPLLGFIAGNPITLSGAPHRDARARYHDHHQSTRRRLRATLPVMAQRHFQSVIDTQPAGSAAGHLVEPFIDRVMSSIFEAEHPDLEPLYWPIASRREQIFAFLHHPARLAALSDVLRSAFDEGGARIGKDQFALLLTYVLQGRDPLSGALGALTWTLVDRAPEARQRLLQDLDAVRIFEQVPPVNYVVRVATSPMRLPDGLAVREGDLIVLMLGWAGESRESASTEHLAFGSGRHVCAGRLLAIDIAEHWLAGLRAAHHRIDWTRLERDRPAGSAFLAWSPGGASGHHRAMPSRPPGDRDPVKAPNEHLSAARCPVTLRLGQDPS
jgi:hypothetical protein